MLNKLKHNVIVLFWIALFNHSESLAGNQLNITNEEWQKINNEINYSPESNLLVNQSNLALHTYVKASNTDAIDFFGYDVDISEDTMVVGAYREASNSTGINGIQTDNSANLSGAVYVFIRSNNTWVQQAYIKASNSQAGDNFGISVALSGDTLVVGANFEASNATGINEDENDNTSTQSGAAYVFTRTAGVWSQQAYLKASNTESFDSFGHVVAISGDTIAVSAIGESSGSRGVNADEDNNDRANSGAVYVFERIEGVWSQHSYLKASNTNGSDRFGFSVGISNDTIVVGADSEDSDSNGVNGNQSNNLATDSGAAYVFKRALGSWSQVAYLKASNTETMDYFGISVAVSGETIVVGAILESSDATGIDGDENNNFSSNSGAAYVYILHGGNWQQQAYLKASNTGSLDYYGTSVDIFDNTIAVGALGEASIATGINGNQADDSAARSGAVYIYQSNAGIWQQQYYVKPTNTDAFDEFAISVALTADTLVAGARTEDSNSTGINGNALDNSYNASGAVYIYSIDLIYANGFE